MRLQKYLAACGIASRRKCEAYILEGKVEVNGQVVQELGTKVEPGDKVTFGGKEVKLQEEYVYYMLNKPVGYVTTVQDEKQRQTVLDLVKDTKHRVYPVGRLDYNTSGLLLLTNDGELTYGLTHPKHHVNKCYEVKVQGVLSDEAKRALKEGVLIDGKMTYPAKVKVLRKGEKSTVFQLTIHEGRNRQVRKMCEAVGYPVLLLKRVSVGKLTLDDLELGCYRALTEREISYLKQISQNG
ncbi:MAG: pseudouridine synthase [Cellulosilyticum sp.]|nr:rRNA pseudouridine synthase [Cellulosilyticum sp.]MEE1070847.1 pseudouridine synthase [Cellulosilyticum sp.]